MVCLWLDAPGDRPGDSGGAEEHFLFALGPDNELVEVPSVYPELDGLLEQGEYFCCGAFISFDDDQILFRVFITRSGRPGITHQVRSRFELRGRIEYDPGRKSYVPRFRLVAIDTSGREPA